MKKHNCTACGKVFDNLVTNLHIMFRYVAAVREDSSDFSVNWSTGQLHPILTVHKKYKIKICSQLRVLS